MRTPAYWEARGVESVFTRPPRPRWYGDAMARDHDHETDLPAPSRTWMRPDRTLRSYEHCVVSPYFSLV